MRGLKILSNVVLTLALVGCAGLSHMMKMPSDAVTGTLTYREKVALPDDAMVTVSLSDISLADAPARVISTVSFPAEGKSIPFDFSLPYSNAQIKGAQTITVSARITHGEKMLFKTTSLNEVLTHGKPAKMDIVLKQVKR
ncbi:YbaY family lipoprotein [Budvicia diplopodorum]|uniref:YbaY family lipoprotein n=1 Tax=Budvicia diplopodorum TaxID=1119056 RepID=UPI00135C1A8A|nr:YbaY family lipoprotein [Budvicia diplopodorum]